MEERIVGNIREWNRNIYRNFPYDSFGIGDKLLLGKVIREEIKRFEECGQGKLIRSAGFIQSVLCEMERYGYRPEKLSDW
jgi:hypothetical protein